MENCTIVGDVLTSARGSCPRREARRGLRGYVFG